VNLPAGRQVHPSSPMPTIRKAGMNDIPVIHALAQSIWPVTYQHILSPSHMEYMLNLFYHPESLKDQMKTHNFIIAELQEPVGFASYSSTEQPNVYKLHKLYVKTDVHRKGLGKALVDYILEQLKMMGASALCLNVNRHNKARQFYEKLGFHVIRHEDIDIGNGYQMNDYVMRLDITY
jgi:GNAT superfamily N-acetyltransferase